MLADWINKILVRENLRYPLIFKIKIFLTDIFSYVKLIPVFQLPKVEHFLC